MTVWIYAVAERPDLPLPGGPGLAGAPVAGVPAGDLLAVVSRHEQLPAEAGAQAFWAHERVVERVMTDRAVLPMRFNSTQPDDDAVRKALLARHDDLRAALDRVRGRVELGVRAVGDGSARTDDDAPAVAAPSGRAWLEARLEAGRLGDAVHEPLAGLAVASQRRPPSAPNEVLRAAYLVDRSALPHFRAAVERLQRPDVAVLCTGPWPPYSFV